MIAITISVSCAKLIGHVLLFFFIFGLFLFSFFFGFNLLLVWVSGTENTLQGGYECDDRRGQRTWNEKRANAIIMWASGSQERGFSDLCLTQLQATGCGGNTHSFECINKLFAVVLDDGPNYAPRSRRKVPGTDYNVCPPPSHYFLSLLSPCQCNRVSLHSLVLPLPIVVLNSTFLPHSFAHSDRPHLHS